MHSDFDTTVKLTIYRTIAERPRPVSAAECRSHHENRQRHLRHESKQPPTYRPASHRPTIK